MFSGTGGVAHRLASRWSVLLVALGLGACGGDESGGGAVDVDSADVAVSAFVTEREVSPAPTSLDVSVKNLPSAAQYIRIRYSTAGIDSADFSPVSEDHIALDLYFRLPYTMRPGVYTDSVIVEGCQDSECAKVFSQGARTLRVKYTVNAATGANAPVVTFSPQTLQLQNLVTDIAQSPRIMATFERVQLPPTIEVLSFTQSAVERVGPPSVDGVTVQHLNLQMKAPLALGPGVYTDTISLKICIDYACTNPFPNNPYTLTVQYTVSNSQTGANGYTIDTMALQANHIASDPVRPLLYVAQTGAVAVVNPEARTVTRTVALGGTPTRLAVSDDGAFLYANLRDSGVIQRFSLPDITPDIAISIGVDPIFQTPLNATRMAVAPGAPRTIATTVASGPSFRGAVIYDDATPRSASILTPSDPNNGVVVDELVWGANSSILYGSATRGPTGNVYEFSADAAGIHLTRDTPGLPTIGGGLHFAGGVLYLDGAYVVDPATYSVTGLERDSYYVNRVLPDGSTGRIFLGNVGVFGFGSALQAYDMESRLLLGQAKLPPETIVYDLTRWGPDGLAMLGNGSAGSSLILIKGPLISGP